MVQPSTALPPVRGEPFPMTWEEFIAWEPEGKTEWVDGEGIAYVSNSTRHVELVVFLAELLGRYLRIINYGKVYAENLIVRLPTRPSGRAPDLFVVPTSELDRVGPRWVEGPVPFVIEFISDESVERDTVEKRAEYERAGVAEYLIVEARTERTGFTFLRLGSDSRYQAVEPDESFRYHSEVLPGFWIDPVWFDEDPLPVADRLIFRMAPEAYRRYQERIFAE